MKISKKNKSAAMMVLIALANYLCGCSVVGLGAGTAIDNARSKERLSKNEFRKAKTGEETVVTLNDGTTITGTFGGVQEKSKAEYLQEYNKFREEQSPQVYLPGIGDTLRIISADGYQGLHRFEGLDVFRKSIIAEELDLPEKREYPLKYLLGIDDRHGKSATGEELQSILSQTEFPLKNRIKIIGSAVNQYIDVGDIDSIELREGGKSHAKWIGLGIGIILDVAWVTAGIMWQNSTRGNRVFD